MEVPFDLDDIEDFRVVIKTKDGKHYGLTPAKGLNREEAKQARIHICNLLFVHHDIVVPSLEEIKANKEQDATSV